MPVHVKIVDEITELSQICTVFLKLSENNEIASSCVLTTQGTLCGSRQACPLNKALVGTVITLGARRFDIAGQDREHLSQPRR